MKIDVCRKIPEYMETLIIMHEEDGVIERTGIFSDALHDSIDEFINADEFKFGKGNIRSFMRLVKGKKQNVILCGAGKKDKLTQPILRGYMASCWREAISLKADNIFLYYAFELPIAELAIGHIIAETALLTSYKFVKYLSDYKHHEPENVHLIYFAKTNRYLNRGILEGRIYADSTILARDLVNEPANVISPEALAEQAKKVALEYGLSIDVFNADRIRRLKMEAFLAVGRGSKNEPKLIIMRYTGNPDKKNSLTALVGKGLTFDSGGYSLKPGNSMTSMKSDMSGAAAVIGTMAAISSLKLKVNVVAIIAAAENMIGSDAYRPGDILTSMSGKTIEIHNTDAEGRLTLIDAVHFAIEKEKADRILDIATLTGAAVAALGKDFTAVLANDDKWYDRLHAASELSGERIWRMPLHEPYNELLKCETADLKNIGGPLAGCITAGLFIHQFVQGKPWIHMDIAGTSFSEKPMGTDGPGATGVGVRTLTNMFRTME
ncbi:MAG: leucyl aminopeptidase [Candidatus Cloacimonetes bacterium]|nr:leucyl aminopeptidase [Candidatus Cloacimonadota bacterium]NLO44165.1 leucyl aminopeptidase [Candidatus Cloacimonadota bacterium]